MEHDPNTILTVHTINADIRSVPLLWLVRIYDILAAHKLVWAKISMGWASVDINVCATVTRERSQRTKTFSCLLDRYEHSNRSSRPL